MGKEKYKSARRCTSGKGDALVRKRKFKKEMTCISVKGELLMGKGNSK